MKEIQISKEKETEILTRLRRSQNTTIVSGIVFILAACSSVYYGPAYSPAFFLPFFIICIPLFTLYMSSIKCIKSGEYKTYSAECRKKGHWLAATIWVDNNETLSKTIKTPQKKLEAAGGDEKRYFSRFEVGKDVGIIQTGKKFWVFHLDEEAATKETEEATANPDEQSTAAGEETAVPAHDEDEHPEAAQEQSSVEEEDTKPEQE